MTEIYNVMYRSGRSASQDQRLESFTTLELAGRYLAEFGDDPHYRMALYVAAQVVYDTWEDMKREIERRFAVAQDIERDIQREKR